jgi:hypothetical protein
MKREAAASSNLYLYRLELKGKGEVMECKGEEEVQRKSSGTEVVEHGKCFAATTTECVPTLCSKPNAIIDKQVC